MHPGLPGSGGNLESDPPRADDDQTRDGAESDAQCLAIVEGAQVVDAVGVGSGDGQLPRGGAGRDQKLVVGDLVVVAQCYDVGSAVECRDEAVAPQLDLSDFKQYGSPSDRF